MTIILKIKTRDAYLIKILAELLQNNIKTACFDIDQKGVSLRMMDTKRAVLIDLSLDSDSFSVYKYLEKETMTIGLNLSHLHKMLKSIKKRDSVELFIDDGSVSDLGIRVIPKENNRVTTSFIKIQNIQNLDIKLPEDYGKPVIVPSGEFQKMCKGLMHISNLTHITAKGGLIKFFSDAGGVMKRVTEFGEVDDTEEEDAEDDLEYSEDFDTEQLTKITKLSGLSANMQIYPKNGKPLLFRCPIGSLGKISIYLKSKSLQEVESRAVESDEE